MKHVQICMEGGVIHSTSVPPGVRLEVRDYDIEDIDPEDLLLNEAGEKYYPIVDEGEDEAPALDTLLPCIRGGEIVTEEADGNPVRKMPASVRTDEYGLLVEIEVGQDAEGQPVRWGLVIENRDGQPLLHISDNDGFEYAIVRLQSDGPGHAKRSVMVESCHPYDNRKPTFLGS
jgi:hypothetical protein